MECKLENVTVYYEVYGQGRPLILLPGWTMEASANARIMEPYFQDRDGWRRIYIDPPGHGRTPGADWITGLDEMLDVLLACIDHIIPGQRFALYGMSLGAYLARGVLFHRQDMVDGLAMVVPVITPTDAERDTPPLTVVVEEPGVMDFLSDEEREMMGSVVVRSKRYLEELRAWPELAEQEQSDVAFLQTIREKPDAYSCTFDVDALEEPFARPALIITGRQDSAVGYADAWRLLDNYPRATFAVFDRAGHFMEEKEPLIGLLINEWLDRVEENAPL
ncbi:MAG: alpha/beta hydrolase [Chloroflexota bacterium]